MLQRQVGQFHFRFALKTGERIASGSLSKLACSLVSIARDHNLALVKIMRYVKHNSVRPIMINSVSVL